MLLLLLFSLVDATTIKAAALFKTKSLHGYIMHTEPPWRPRAEQAGQERGWSQLGGNGLFRMKLLLGAFHSQCILVVAQIKWIQVRTEFIHPQQCHTMEVNIWASHSQFGGFDSRISLRSQGICSEQQNVKRMSKPAIQRGMHYYACFKIREVMALFPHKNSFINHDNSRSSSRSQFLELRNGFHSV